MNKNHVSGHLRNVIRKMINEELSGHVVAEEEHNFLPDSNPMDDIPSVTLHIDDEGMMKIEVSAFFHTSHNGKVPLLANNPVLQELVMKAIQVETQKAFRKAVHGVLGIPYGLPESTEVPDKSNESMIIRLRQTPTYKQLLLGSNLKEGSKETKVLKNTAVTKIGEKEYQKFADFLKQLGNPTGHEANIRQSEDPQKSLTLGRRTLSIGGRTITE